MPRRSFGHSPPRPCERALDPRRASGVNPEPSRPRRRPLIQGERIHDLSLEWLEADGLGGFAMGTACGIRTRRYHGLLCTARTPPTGRVMLVSAVEAWVETAGGRHALASHHYLPAVTHPDGASR